MEGRSQRRVAQNLRGVLAKDPENRYALEAMGYLYREDNDPKMAERIFQPASARLIRTTTFPTLLWVIFYTQTRQFQRADDNYQQAYKLAPDRMPSIVANAANAGD